MEIIRNNKGGSKLCAEGYLYTKKSSNSTRICREYSQRNAPSCKGCAHTDLEVKQLPSVTEHRHDPDPNKVKAAKVKNIIKTAALTNRGRPAHIWLATNNDEGKIYYYEESGSKSLWRLPQQEYTVKEGFLYRTFLLREGKKVRKNWTQSYARYLMANFDKGYNGLLYFSKTKDEDKKAEEFEFYPTCHLEHTTDKKTSRQQVLGLRNGLETEDGMQYTAPTTEKEEKKGKRGSEKIKREASVEHLSPDSKGITDKLRNFIKRRPLKETLEKKGIYKESVFGSTLAELRVAQRNYTILSREKEIHNLSGALKLFFRELKEPLIPFDNYQDFIQATGSEYRKMNQQADKLTKAVNKLPQENYDTLKLLLQHLLRVSEFESENRMSISNLAIVFGPCLLWPRVTSSHDLMTDVMLHNRVIEGILADFPKIFSSRK
ncbi:Rho GTPase-activating protein 27-like [Homarus americanus]|uniref:Rho GTPase-activating protein 27-like n=1 Tax=Homarus americanus TaxID=6706 RepID=A0A8J5KET7_HOMAM|nr:Rho GTPase-activating protein 27-like [Homarus americanus]